MSLVAPIVDGVLQTSTASSESLSKSKSNGNSINSDTFLTLLVAEMQNQDPLEPTSNTEWVSQYATFTQVEQIGEMADSMDVLRANSLIGKEVIMKVTSESTGETSYQRGIVDYIVMENGEALLNIGGSNYSMDDLDTVASNEYYEAYDFYTEFVKKIDALPSLKLIDKSYENTVGELYEMYNNMTDYQSEYLTAYAPLYIENYELYIKKMEQLGITYDKEEVVEEVTTLDDVLEAFNKKMDALMEQMASIGTNGTTSGNNKAEDSAGSNQNASGDTANASGSTNSAGNTGNASGSADNAGSANNASGSIDNAGNADNVSGSTDNAGSADNVSGSTDNAGSADNASGSTENAENADNASGSTENAGNADNASGSTENAGNADNASGSTENAGNADNASGSTENAGNADNTSGSTENVGSVDHANEAEQNTATPEAEGEDSQVSDDTLDLLTQDI